MSQQEHLLGLERSRDSSTASPSRMDTDVIVESVMVENVGESVAPSESTTQRSVVTPPEGESAQEMATDPPTSPVSPNEDDLLSGATAVSVEAGMATLWVDSTPERWR